MRRRNRESEEDYWARLAAEEAELARLNARPLWEKINDASDIHDLKVVLHEIVDELDTALASRGGFPLPR